MAVGVPVAGPVAVVGIFVSTALERKTHGNGKKNQNYKSQKPLHETSPPGVALGRGLVRGLGASLRFREVRSAALDALWEAGRPVIYTVWHGRILMLPYLYGHSRRIHALTSRSVRVKRPWPSVPPSFILPPPRCADR